MNIRYQALLTMGGMGIAGSLLAAGPTVTLPTPCAAGAAACTAYSPAGSTTVSQFVTSGSASQATAGNTLTVTQNSAQAILNWSSFNIGTGGSVVFNQPSATAIALNKIYQSSPSSIFGALKANGQIYLMNANGFIFGQGSSVNVGSLLVSSLGLTQGDAELANGILNASLAAGNLPALQSDGRQFVEDSNGNPVLDANGQPQPVQILVQPGAQITAADSGRVLLAGQTVTNAGTISSPDGQIILAAGQQVYLQAADTAVEPWLRGLVVEVNGTQGQGEAASNLAGGSLTAAHGNVSLVGLAVNQSGRISATTSVSANGSVVLKAADAETNTGCAGGVAICATNGDQLVIGSTSVIDLSPDTTDTSTAVAAQTQQQSTIQLSGLQIDMHGGQITAPNGSMSVIAAQDPGLGAVSPGNSAAQIRIDSGTNIDLSGSTAELPMSANLLSVQLFANALEDDPNQRSGPLHGQTVIVDTRDGRPAIISDPAWQAALAGIQQSILQRTASGGSVSFASEGDVVFNAGATINVSGGQWNYAAGTIQTSQLVGANGQLYSIESASPMLSYTGVLNPTYKQTYPNWGVQITQPTPGLGQVQAAYSEGFSAGSVSFVAPSLAIAGSLQGSAYNGLYQRGLSSIPAESTLSMARGGQLVIGQASAAEQTLVGTGYVPDFIAPSVTFAPSAPAVSVEDQTPYTSTLLTLPTAYLANGFQGTQIYSNGTVTLPAGEALNLGAGGTLNVQAPHIEIGSSITAPGGSIGLFAAQTEANLNGADTRLDVTIGTGVALDVRGQWTNNWTLSSSANQFLPTYQDGGSIVLSLTDPATSAGIGSPYSMGGILTLGSGASLEASGGGWLQSNGKIIGGKGGSVTIDAGPAGSALRIGSGVGLDAWGVNGALGGSFALRAPALSISSGAQWAGAQSIDASSGGAATLALGSALFSNEGLSSVTLTATGTAGSYGTDSLTVAQGTQINAQQSAWQLLPSIVGLPSTSAGVAGYAQTQALPGFEANPYTLSLRVVPDVTDQTSASSIVTVGQLDLQAGSSITAPTGASKGSTVSLTGYGSILIDGAIDAPAGNLSVTLNDITQLPVTAGAASVFADPGFIANQRIELGSAAALNVSGTTVSTPSALGYQLGTVLPGGSVTMIADAGAILADAGSVIDVSGASAVLDRQPIVGQGLYSPQTVGSIAGSLTLSAVEPIWLSGSMRAAPGANGDGALAGGTLSVTELLPPTILASTPGAVPYASDPSTLTLTTDLSGLQPAVTNADASSIPVGALAGSGFDALRLQSTGSIALTMAAPLALGREITLDSPALSVPAGMTGSLSAPFIAIGNSSGNAAPAATGGTGALSIGSAGSSPADAAQQIVLSGQVSTLGVGSLTLRSVGDIELIPQLYTGSTSGSAAGQLLTSTLLNLNSARLFPATNTVYAFGVTNGAINIGQVGTSIGTPLSVNGQLIFNATDITSSGSLYAPFGQLTFNATNSLTLASGSLTSVSGAGLTLPYGQTLFDGLEWVYAVAGGSTPVTGVPTRLVTLSAPSVTVAKGATVDIAGGGDLSAFEWVPGTGGSTDALGASAAAASGLYAILPGTANQYAAFDEQNFLGSGIAGGASVYLSGIAGLPAGVYPLLPARDALLSGAYLIQIEPGFQSEVPGTIGTMANGAPIVAGYFTFGDTGLRTAASGYTGFALYPGGVYPGSHGQGLATYTTTLASSFFGQQAVLAGKSAVGLPADAGALAINAGTALNALGTVDSAAGTGGSAGTIDVSATDLTVTNGGQAGAGVSVSASVLNSWNAGDLVLGGQLSSDGTTLTVDANSVTVAPGASLSAGQVLAVANNSIDIEGSVSSTSGATGKAPTAPPVASTLSLVAPAGSTSSVQGAALFAVSDSALALVNRGAGANSVGTLTFGSGAQVSTAGALAMDAPGGVAFGGTLSASGAEVSLSSNGIALGGANAADATTVGSAWLSALQQASSLRLASSSGIDIQAPLQVALSGAGSMLTLSAAALNDNQSATASFSAGTIALQGQAAAVVAPTSGAGTLQFNAKTLTVGPGDLTLNGNTQTTVQLTGALVGQGAAGLGMSGNVTINATELTAQSGANVSLDVPAGTLTIGQTGAADKPSALVSSLGGALALGAEQINDNGTILVPGGQISLTSTGALGVGSAASIDAGGILVAAGNAFHTVTVGAAGGTVTLSASGDLTMASGSQINVAGAGRAPGGDVIVSGGGTVSVGSTLNGAGGTGAQGGSVSISAGTLAGGSGSLAALTGQGLNSFTNQISVRTQNGDLTVAAGTTITANDVQLSADTGVIDVGGTITTAGLAGNGLDGRIGLYGGTGLTLESGATLTALGSGTNGQGGQVELSTAAGAITLAQGSQITVGNGAGAGQLTLRAPALLNGQGGFTGDVAIVNDGTSLVGANQLTIVPVLPTFTAAQLGGSADLTQSFATVETAVNSFNAAANGAIAGRFQGLASGVTPLVEAGVVVQQSGDLTLGNALDLNAEQSTGALSGPIDLTVEATGNLTIGGSITDGITSGTWVLPGNSPQSSAASSSLHFIAGAAPGAANPLTVLASNSGSLTLGNNVIVSTGTGTIDLAAAGDITFSSGSGVFTTGLAGAASQAQKVQSQTATLYYPVNGGAVSVTAGGSINAALLGESPSSWMIRQAGQGVGGWGLDLAAYASAPWTIATLGGGDIRVLAGADATNLSVAAADSLTLPVAQGAQFFPSGGVQLRVGGNIDSGQYYVADGSGTFSAGRAFTSDTAGATTIGSIFELQNSQVALWAQTGLTLSAALNPTVLTEPLNTSKNPIYFYSYGPGAGLSAQTSAGNITLLGGNLSSTTLEPQLGSVAANNSVEAAGSGSLALPPSLAMAALSGDVVSGGQAAGVMFPSASGQLSIFAGHDINNLTLSMSDSPVADIPTTANYFAGSGVFDNVSVTALGAIHTGDSTPVSIVAGNDIQSLTVNLPKAANIAAGSAMTGLFYSGQNLSTTDLTTITAGGAINDPVEFDSNGNVTSFATGSVQVGGPGRLDILAGADINLGFGNGVVTLGNLADAQLPSVGADLTMAAGLTQLPNYSQFLNKIIEPSSTYQSELVSYVEGTTGKSGLSATQADAVFASLSPDQQRPLINTVFFDALNQSGLSAATLGPSGYAAGYNAITALFPGSPTGGASDASNPYDGSISLTYSRIATTSGGSIALFVPNGSINVGLADAPSGTANAKPASELGIVAQGTGNVDVYSEGSVNVNSSRIFTLGGGNILIWSEQGNIDAGNGAKTSLSLPPPTLLIDPTTGVVQLVYDAATAGSGIRTIQSTPAVPAGDVNLVAPEGSVNAGDAGIGAAGNINIAATVVIGASNISFGGSATGVPAAVGNLSASLSSASASASSTASAANGLGDANAAASKEAAAPIAQAALSWLEVFVTGLGEENCKPEDTECLKRQKSQ